MAEGWARLLGNEHWALDDPAKATGSEEEILAVFRGCRDDIRQRVQDLIKRLLDERF